MSTRIKLTPPTSKFRVRKNNEDLIFIIERGRTRRVWDGWFERPGQRGVQFDGEYEAPTIKQLIADAGLTPERLMPYN